MKGVDFFKHVAFGILAFLIFTLPDYWLSISWEMPVMQFSAATIMLSAFRVALFNCLLVFYIRKVIGGPCKTFEIERPNADLAWVLISFLIPVSASLAIVIFTEGKFIVSYDFNQNIKCLVFGLFKVGFCSAIAEEFFFRGFLFNLFECKFNKKVALISTSMLFAAAHLWGVKSLFDAVSIMLAGTVVGMMFALIAKSTGSIWNAIIVHGVWNFITSKAINISFSENSKTLIAYVLHSANKLIFNKSTGIETSIFTLLCYLAVIFAVLINSKKLSNLEK